MRTVDESEWQWIGGGAGAISALWKATLPARAVGAAATLGWAVGSAIYRTYDVQIQAGLDRVFR
jgi:hypothetical protein